MSAIKTTLDELMYRSYRTQRMQFPQIPPERWVKIFPEWAAYEERFVSEFAACLMLAAEDLADQGITPSLQASVGTGGADSSVESALPLCGVLQQEDNVQRVMDAHNYAGSQMSKVRFDAEVSLGIERMRAEEEREGD